MIIEGGKRILKSLYKLRTDIWLPCIHVMDETYSLSKQQASESKLQKRNQNISYSSMQSQSC